MMKTTHTTLTDIYNICSAVLTRRLIVNTHSQWATKVAHWEALYISKIVTFYIMQFSKVTEGLKLLLDHPCFPNKFGKRSFSFVVPTIRNKLHFSIRLSQIGYLTSAAHLVNAGTSDTVMIVTNVCILLLLLLLNFRHAQTLQTTITIIP